VNAAEDRATTHRAGPFLWTLAVVVLVAGAAVAIRLGLEEWGRPNSVLLLLAAAAVAGFFPVRLPALRINGTATHVFVFAALALAGPFAAICADLAGVVGAMLGRRRRPRMIHLIFNLGLATIQLMQSSQEYRRIWIKPCWMERAVTAKRWRWLSVIWECLR